MRNDQLLKKDLRVHAARHRKLSRNFFTIKFIKTSRTIGFSMHDSPQRAILHATVRERQSAHRASRVHECKLVTLVLDMNYCHLVVLALNATDIYTVPGKSL